MTLRWYGHAERSSVRTRPPARCHVQAATHSRSRVLARKMHVLASDLFDVVRRGTQQARRQTRERACGGDLVADLRYVVIARRDRCPSGANQAIAKISHE